MSFPQKLSLGRLEQSVMDVLWRKGSATVRDVVEALSSRRPLAYTTVMTVMNRLVAHRWLRRQANRSGAYDYAPVYSREDFSALASRHSVDQLVQQYGDAAIIQFMEKLDRLPADKLAKLKRQVNEKSE